MAIFDTGPIPNIDGMGNRIAQRMFVRVENTGVGNLPANVLIEVYRITEPNANGYAQQIIYAQNVVVLSEFGSAVNETGPVFVLPVTLNSPLIPMFGVRITTFPDPGGGSQISATIFTEKANGELVALQRILPGDFAVVPINPVLQAVNEAQTPTEMRAAIEDPSLGLDLTNYETLSEAQKNQVAEILLENRPQIGYPSVQSVQNTLDFAVDQVTVNPDNIFVQAGAVGGDGSKANPFGTITQGINAVNPGGTVNILSGTYSITSQITVNKQGVTLLGEPGTELVVSVPGPVFLPMLISAPNVTINGLTITSDEPYQTEFIQIGANNVTITNNTIYGPPQPLPMSNWIVNRALISQGGLSGMLITNNTFYSLRTGMYINPNGTGAINNNIVYNTKGGFIVDQAFTTFLGNSWGIPPNEFDIVLLAGTTAGPPYDDLSELSAENNNATISDQR